jgi:hypothetical protein
MTRNTDCVCVCVCVRERIREEKLPLYKQNNCDVMLGRLLSALSVTDSQFREKEHSEVVVFLQPPPPQT